MKVGSLFGIVRDVKDVLDFFQGVDTPEQMISRLERLKRGEAEDFLVCMQAMSLSTDVLLEDVLEMSSSGVEDLNDGPEDFSEAELAELEEPEEKEKTPTEATPEKKT